MQVQHVIDYAFERWSEAHDAGHRAEERLWWGTYVRYRTMSERRTVRYIIDGQTVEQYLED